MAATPTPTPVASPGAAVPVCNGKYKGVLEPSPHELADILKKHAEWSKDIGNKPNLANDPRRANLCGADLWGVHLNGADLSFAHLNPRGPEPRGPELRAPKQRGPHWRGAERRGPDPREPVQREPVARAPDWREPDTRADLTRADLTRADLTGAQVSKAKLSYADLKETIYAPVSQPPDPYVAGIKGLATIRAESGEQIGLVQLRKLLQDAGLRDSVREATYSIQSKITRDQLSTGSALPEKIEGCLRTVGFNWTTAYGLHPQRAFRWILLLSAILTPVYMFAMLRPTATSGVIQVFPADRLDGTAGDPADEEKRKKQLVHAKGWRDAASTAAYFSLISAVNIGFEAFTPGDWIRRLQTREYSLEAVGWVRIVARAQALLSVYLLAMWVLTQFGQPFE